MHFLILLGVFWATLQLPLDLDLGWHLRYGQYFFQTGHVLRDNIISYVWPQYHWVQASWGFDLLVYQLSSHFSFWGLSLATAIISLGIFLIITWPFSKKSVAKLFVLGVIFLSLTIPLYSAGLRAQTLSALLFAIFIIITSPPAIIKSRWVWILPILFLLWANLHGGFVLGLILAYLLLSVHGIVLILKKYFHTNWLVLSTKRWLLLMFLLILSTITPIFNPWGLRIYEETFKHSTNINLTLISEWMPLTGDSLTSTLAFIITLFVFVTAARRRKPLDLPYLAAFLIVSYLTFSALRFIILFGIMATYYFASHSDFTHNLLSPRQTKLATQVLAVTLLSLAIFDELTLNNYFFFKTPLEIRRFSWKTYCEILDSCSEAITAAMRQNLPKGNGYHPYNYGGYLSWRLPEVKTFVDGRMAAWKENGQTPPLVTEERVFEDKAPIMFRKFDNQYHFGWLIIPSISLLNDYLAKFPFWELRYADKSYRYYVKINQ